MLIRGIWVCLVVLLPSCLFANPWFRYQYSWQAATGAELCWWSAVVPEADQGGVRSGPGRLRSFLNWQVAFLISCCHYNVCILSASCISSFTRIRQPEKVLPCRSVIYPRLFQSRLVLFRLRDARYSGAIEPSTVATFELPMFLWLCGESGL